MIDKQKGIKYGSYYSAIKDASSHSRQSNTDFDNQKTTIVRTSLFEEKHHNKKLNIIGTNATMSENIQNYRNQGLKYHLGLQL